MAIPRREGAKREEGVRSIVMCTCKTRNTILLLPRSESTDTARSLTSARPREHKKGNTNRPAENPHDKKRSKRSRGRARRITRSHPGSPALRLPPSPLPQLPPGPSRPRPGSPCLLPKVPLPTEAVSSPSVKTQTQAYYLLPA